MYIPGKEGPHQFTSPVHLGKVTLVQVLDSGHSESHPTSRWWGAAADQSRTTGRIPLQ